MRLVKTKELRWSSGWGVAVTVALWLAPGCGGEPNPCAEAAAHLKQCAGLSVQGETCDLNKAALVLSTPCEFLANNRGTFSAGFGASYLDYWWNTPGGTGFNPFDPLGEQGGDIASGLGWIPPNEPAYDPWLDNPGYWARDQQMKDEYVDWWLDHLLEIPR
jgi:hypothetical protein